MSRRQSDLRDGPSVVLIEDAIGDMDAWLAELRLREPIELPVSATDLVAEARSEGE